MPVLKRREKPVAERENISTQLAYLFQIFRRADHISDEEKLRLIRKLRQAREEFYHTKYGEAFDLVGENGEFYDEERQRDYIEIVDICDLFNEINRDFVPEKFDSTLYLAEGEKFEAEEFATTVFRFIDFLGYTSPENPLLECGSWISRAGHALKRAIQRDEVQQRALAVENVLFGAASIVVDEKVVGMVSELMQALADRSSSAAIDTGLFLFLKIPDGSGSFSILAKRLTLEEREILSEDPTLVQRPTEILHRIKELKQVRRDRIEEIIDIRGSASVGDRMPKQIPADNCRKEDASSDLAQFGRPKDL